MRKYSKELIAEYPYLKGYINERLKYYQEESAKFVGIKSQENIADNIIIDIKENGFDNIQFAIKERVADKGYEYTNIVPDLWKGLIEEEEWIALSKLNEECH